MAAAVWWQLNSVQSELKSTVYQERTTQSGKEHQNYM